MTEVVQYFFLNYFVFFFFFSGGSGLDLPNLQNIYVVLNT